MGPHRGLVKEPLSDLAQVTARGTGLRVAEREADARKPVWLVLRVELCCASVCVSVCESEYECDVRMSVTVCE